MRKSQTSRLEFPCKREKASKTFASTKSAQITTKQHKFAPGRSWKRLGVFRGGSLAVLGHLEAFGGSWGRLGKRLGGILGSFWGVLAAKMAQLRRHLGRLGCLLGPFGRQ